MTAGRPRKPSNVLALNGAMARNPGRHADRANEPTPEPVARDTPPPPYFTQLDAITWRDVISKLPTGVLTVADIPLFESLVLLITQMRYRPCIALDDGTVRVMPLDPKLATTIATLCGRFGMSPSDRSKVSVKKDGPAASPYGDF